MPPRAAYIHVPFCRHRCGYCNFTVLAGHDNLAEQYLEALARELSALATPRAVHTLYVGGGTPTRLAASQLQRLLTLVAQWFGWQDGYEFTVEANPADLDRGKAAALADAGVNRISLGVQSFQADKLAILERDHEPRQIFRAYELARRFVDCVSLDLIFATPGETLADWRADLRTACELQPDHVSTYGLTFEKGTLFWNRRMRGELAEPDEALQRELYEEAIDFLTPVGLLHYEVSSFSRPGRQCRHNQVYWSGGGYYAAGAGAARFVNGCRETNHRSVTTYVRRVLAGDDPVAERETLGPEEAARERLVFGLRMLAGVDRDAFRAETGYEITSLVGNPLEKYVRLGLLELDGRRIRLTREGLMVSDSIWPDFLTV